MIESRQREYLSDTNDVGYKRRLMDIIETMCIYVRHKLRMDSESILDMKLGDY